MPGAFTPGAFQGGTAIAQLRLEPVRNLARMRIVIAPVVGRKDRLTWRFKGDGARFTTYREWVDEPGGVKIPDYFVRVIPVLHKILDEVIFLGS